MWNKAIEDAIHKVGSNMANHPGKLPHIAEGNSTNGETTTTG